MLSGSELGDIRGEAIILPELQYGYRTTPASWSELEAIVASGDLARLSRSRQQQIEYERYKIALLKKWNGLLDYVLCEKFQYQPVFDAMSGKLSARAPKDAAGRIMRKLLLNDFPYYMQAPIQHWIL